MKEILDSVESYNSIEPWKGTLTLSGISLKSESTEEVTLVKEPVDIFSGVTDNKVIYYKRHMYNSSADWDDVITAIKNDCLMNGYSVNLNGAYCRKIDGEYVTTRGLYCTHRECYHTIIKNPKQEDVDPREQPVGRKRSLISDRKNQRTDGRKLTRQTSTTKSKVKCPFRFKIYYHKLGFVIIKPTEKYSCHLGHRKKLQGQTTLRKSEVTKEMKNRMIEDAGICMPISTTQRILNIRNLQRGPFINRQLVREFRASNILKNCVDGSIVKIGKNKGDMDLVMELLKKNNARVTYLAVQPKFGIDTSKSSNRISTKDTTIIASNPHLDEEIHDDMKEGTFVVHTSHEKLKLRVIRTEYSYLEIDYVHEESPLNGLVRKGDQIIALNGEELSGICGTKFVELVGSLKKERKSITVWRGEKTANIHHLEQQGVLEERSLCQDLRSITGKDKIFTPNMYKELEETAHKYRKEALDPNERYHLYLSVAWMIPQNYYAALMWGSTLFIDSTFNVCVFSNFRQLSIVCKTTSGKALVICRIGLPHEKSYLFDYCLKSVIPSLMSNMFCKRIRTIISDGDIYLCRSISESIKDCYVNAIRLRCGWHIIYKGWENNVQPYLIFHEHCSPSNRDSFEKLIKSWINSWMKSSVSSQDEMETSKDLLLKWIVSSEVTENVCSKEVCDIIIKWIRTSVLPFEREFAFHYRKMVANESNYTCCIIEGTHNALKHNSLAVQRTDTLPIYVKKACDYDIMKLKEMQATVATNHEKRYLFGKSWMNELVENGALLTYSLIQWSENYVSQIWKLEDGLPIFAVLYHSTQDEDENPILSTDDVRMHIPRKTKTVGKEDISQTYEVPRSCPRFHHSWLVKMVRNENGTISLQCSCCMYPRDRLVCQHIIHVRHYHLKHLDWFEDDFLFSDYGVCWWKISYTLCFKPHGTHTKEELDLLHNLIDLVMNDNRYGPEIRPKDDRVDLNSKLLKHQWDENKKVGKSIQDASDCDPIGMITKSAFDRIKNWNVSKEYDDIERDSNMIPKHYEYNFDGLSFTYDDSCAKNAVNSAIHQQACKKKVLDMVYDIFEKVECAKEEDFFARFSSSIDKFHAESVQISFKQTESKTKSPAKIFAGSERHTSNSPMTKRIHAFHKKPKSTPKRKKSSYNFSSP